LRNTTPKVFLLSRPSFDYAAAAEYLSQIDGMPWLHRRAEGDLIGSQDLIEFAGRACYRSWAPGLNANVTRVRQEQDIYLENILRSGHGSVLEHAQYTFVFHNISRVATHELVRHRAGVAISQESLRYVRLTDLGFRVPEIFKTDKPFEGGSFEDAVVTMVEHLEDFQQRAANYFGLDDDGVPFHYKKEVTSALRRLAPIGLSTMMVWSANVRTLRHVIEMRTALGAEEEIRTLFQMVGKGAGAVRRLRDHRGG
jgi:thymidylate synthase (FAD)